MLYISIRKTAAVQHHCAILAVSSQQFVCTYLLFVVGDRLCTMPAGNTCALLLIFCVLLCAYFFSTFLFNFSTKMSLYFRQTSLLAAARACCSFLVHGTQQYQAGGSISIQYSSAVRFSQSKFSSTYLPICTVRCCRHLPMPHEATPTLAH